MKLAVADFKKKYFVQTLQQSSSTEVVPRHGRHQGTYLRTAEFRLKELRWVKGHVTVLGAMYTAQSLFVLELYVWIVEYSIWNPLKFPALSEWNLKMFVCVVKISKLSYVFCSKHQIQLTSSTHYFVLSECQLGKKGLFHFHNTHRWGEIVLMHHPWSQGNLCYMWHPHIDGNHSHPKSNNHNNLIHIQCPCSIYSARWQYQWADRWCRCSLHCLDNSLGRMAMSLSHFWWRSNHHIHLICWSYL